MADEAALFSSIDQLARGSAALAKAVGALEAAALRRRQAEIADMLERVRMLVAHLDEVAHEPQAYTPH